MNKDQYIKKLYEAYKTKIPLTNDVFPEGVTNLNDAYKIQHAFTALKEQNGEKLSGYKLSLTNQSSQKLFDITEPLYGQLTDACLVSELNINNINEILVELELVFVAQEDLSANDNHDQILSKVLVAPGIEIPHSRYKNWFPNLTKEHFCCDGAVGGWLAYGNPVPATYKSLDKISGSLLHNGELIGKGISDIVLNHPLNAVEWLLNKLQTHGLIVKKGMYISSGTFFPPLSLKIGKYEGHIENFGVVSLLVT